jgi:hypothetical protein
MGLVAQHPRDGDLNPSFRLPKMSSGKIRGFVLMSGSGCDQ